MRRALPILLLVLLAGCASRDQATDPSGYRAEGQASYYSSRHHGRRTASGERFNMRALTAAHHSLPFGSQVRVTNLRNQRSVVVRINDRGPYARGRIIDLSRAAAERLGMLGNGVAPVRIEALGH